MCIHEQYLSLCSLGSYWCSFGLVLFVVRKMEEKKKMRGIHIKVWTVMNNGGTKAEFTV